MDDKKLSEKLIDNIKNEDISPAPKWKFKLKNYLVWMIGLLFVVLGGLSVSVIVYMFRYGELAIYRQLTNSWVEFLLLLLPPFWLILLGVTVLAVLYDLRCTKRGYKYPLSLTALVVLLASLSLGAIFYFGGIGRAMDSVLGRQAPYYSKVINPRVDFWCRPDEGRLAGIVSSVTGEKTFILRGCQGGNWTVQISEIDSTLKKEHINLHVESGASVRAIGRKLSEWEFMAERIMPMHQGKEFFNRHHPSRNIETGCLNCMHQ
ncbi:MAG: hypothetical protein ACOCVY_02070 [Patescibacteria group bacterium]